MYMALSIRMLRDSMFSALLLPFFLFLQQPVKKDDEQKLDLNQQKNKEDSGKDSKCC